MQCLTTARKELPIGEDVEQQDSRAIAHQKWQLLPTRVGCLLYELPLLPIRLQNGQGRITQRTSFLVISLQTGVPA